MKDSLAQMFAQWAGSECTTIEGMPQSGSDRRYYRLSGNGKTAIGVYNADVKENAAFLGFSRSLAAANVSVPAIYAADQDKCIYLQQDLGNQTLFQYLTQQRAAVGQWSVDMTAIYEKTLTALVDIQVKGRTCINYNLCYPRAAFDRQSMLWDLHYFKYYFLKLAHLPFDEQLLENDYNTLINYLLEVDCDFFLYRDFQSRNIMVCNNQPWFIDYQGGRRGALQYDVASLLFDAKADIPAPVRQRLLNFYLDRLSERINIDRVEFLNHFYAYVYIRIMQAMGAYGFRGFYERKEHFLKSIPFAINNLQYLLHNHQLPVALPELNAVWNGICESETLKAVGAKPKLTVTVSSFSYKRGWPTDNSGNGGGFVFDCRALPNPGRYPQYKTLTGKDNAVIQFFANEQAAMQPFNSLAQQMVRINVERYIQRGFDNLMVSFGCTGGQHRSVYCAECMATWLRATFDVNVIVKHLEQDNKLQ